jgi:hypothetical protein
VGHHDHYGSTEHGFFNAQNPGMTFNPSEPLFQAIKTGDCDAQGFFTFDGVADGSFFVFTRVTWRVSGAIQGGSLMKRVTLSGGKKTEIVLTTN